MIDKERKKYLVFDPDDVVLVKKVLPKNISVTEGDCLVVTSCADNGPDRPTLQMAGVRALVTQRYQKTHNGPEWFVSYDNVFNTKVELVLQIVGKRGW